ncbi:MAG: hypothetical protein QOF70_3882 [Acetobacteraceae bacterium]|nr:hypothetical protein [Acetobacteraceae bacterium]
MVFFACHLFNLLYLLMPLSSPSRCLVSVPRNNACLYLLRCVTRFSILIVAMTPSATVDPRVTDKRRCQCMVECSAGCVGQISSMQPVMEN